MFKAFLSGVLGGLLTSLALAAPARAEEARPPRTYAVLIGISKYADEQIKPRPHAEADVQALYDLFTNKDYVGADPANVRLLTGTPDEKRGGHKATRENIVKALQWVAGEARANDPVLLVFVGEGGQLGETGDRRCYFAVDSTVKGRSKDAVAAAEIGEALKNLKSQKFCALIDVDFKGYVGAPSANSDQPLGKDPYKEFIGDDGTEEHAALPGRVVFLATNGLSTSLDLKEQGHGLFTQLVLDALKGAADKEGYEPDGSVTVDELIEYLDKQLPEMARKHGTTEQEKSQTHFVLGGRGNHFVLSANPAVAAKVKARLDKFARMVADEQIPARYAEEGKTLLSAMPRLEAQRKLRKEYQKLVDGAIELKAFEDARVAILDSTKISRAEATAFARKVIEAIGVIRDGYVKEVNQGEMVAWAVRGLYKRIDEKIPEDVEARLKKAKGLRERELVQLLADVRQRLGKREDLDNQKDVNVTLQRMLANLDPYTTYIDPEMKQKFNDDIGGNFTGIGIQIRKDPVTDQLKVVTPIKGSPAYRAGLQAGDVITKITREVDSKGNKLDPVEVIPTKGLPLADAVKKILGQPDTKVKLTVQREGVAKPLEYEITRGRVEVESVLGYKRKADDDWDYYVDPVHKIGYIRLTQFSRNSYRDLKRVMDDLVRRGLNGFILDLRFNPGGLLDSAVKISDLFIDDGLIVTIRPRAGREARFSGAHEGSLLDFPMVCLINGYSASGSEIVSAALQDHNRAVIVGERSYGKGSVQNIQPFEGGDIKLTTASFWRPSGRNLNKASTKGSESEEWGVTPDKGFEVKLSYKEREDLAEAQREAEVIRPKNARPEKEKKEEFKDRQLETALDYLRGQIKTAARQPAGKAG